MKRWFAALLPLLFTGCAYSIHEVHVSDFTPYNGAKQGKEVEAAAEQFTIMGFASETNYVEQAVAMLKTKCPNGEVVGITTEFSTALGFFSWYNRVHMKGRCIGGSNA